MTIIYLLHVESKRFEVTYSRDSLLINKSPSSSLATEFLLILVAFASFFWATIDGVASSWLVGPSVFATAITFATAEDFPNVYSGNCAAKIIDNSKTKFIIAWKHDKYEGKYQNMTFFLALRWLRCFSLWIAAIRKEVKVNKNFSLKQFTQKVTCRLNFFRWKVVELSYLIMTNSSSMISCVLLSNRLTYHVTFYFRLALTDWTPKPSLHYP